MHKPAVYPKFHGQNLVEPRDQCKLILMTFAHCVDHVLRHEGGYVNDPKDPGGETKYGISKRTYPTLDIKNLTRAEAKEIYFRDFWMKHRIAELPEGLRLAALDFAVHSGGSRSIRYLQGAVNVRRDGILGPVSLGAINSRSPAAVLTEYLSRRMLFLTRLNNFEHNKIGWTRRMFDVAVHSF